MPPNAFSKHPTKYKMAEFHIYAYRAINICSDIDSLSNEIIYLKSILKSKCFNPSIILKLGINSAISANFTLDPIESNFAEEASSSFIPAFNK